MHYLKKSYLKWNFWNNAFSLEERENKKLFIPKLKKININNLDKIELWNKICFEDYDFNNKLQSCTGLKHFYEIDLNINNSKKTEKKVETKNFLSLNNNKTSKKIYLFDNHNHAYYFWYLARDNKIISDNAILFHIDEHADTRDPIQDKNYLNYEKIKNPAETIHELALESLSINQNKYLQKPESENLDNIYKYCNYYLNVWNYIIPAEQEWLISETI